jgi:hypothetical protein
MINLLEWILYSPYEAANLRIFYLEFMPSKSLRKPLAQER